jgi:hypothetical protein
MRNASTWWIIAAIMFILDLYVFQALRTVTHNASERARTVIHITYWVVSGLTLLALLSFPYIYTLQTSKVFRNYIFAVLVGLFFAKLVGVVFFLTDDIRRGALFLLGKILPDTGARFMGEGNTIPRSTFLSWLGPWPRWRIVRNADVWFQQQVQIPGKKSKTRFRKPAGIVQRIENRSH